MIDALTGIREEGYRDGRLESYRELKDSLRRLYPSLSEKEAEKQAAKLLKMDLSTIPV